MIYIKYFTLDIVRIRIYPDCQLYEFRNILTDLNEKPDRCNEYASAAIY